MDLPPHTDTDAETLSERRPCFIAHEQSPDEYDGIYIPGGHGAMVDFPDNTKLQQLIAAMFSKGAPSLQRRSWQAHDLRTQCRNQASPHPSASRCLPLCI